MSLPTLDPLWRASDQETVRRYAGIAVVEASISDLISRMNSVATISPATVTTVRAWIDEAETLEVDWADKVAAGTAHLGNATSYEGPAPGATITRAQTLEKADVLEWDTSLLKVKTTSDGSAGSTAGGVVAERIADLHRYILDALGLRQAISHQSRLMRS